MKNIILGIRNLRSNPLEFPTRILGIPNEWVWDGVKKIILSVFNHRKTAVKAGHAMSKDWTGGVLVIEWLLLHYGEARVICTGPTMDQVKDVMFTEIEKQYDRLRARWPEFRKDWLTTKKLEITPDCFAVGMTPRDTKDTVGKFQGRHSPNMLVLITEAQAVDHSVFKQLRGLITSPNSRVLELGNPLINFGDYYEHCTNPALGYNVIHLPVSESPNIKAGKELIPGMCSAIYVQEFENELKAIGINPADDPEYQGRVLAEFPQDSIHTWIPLAKIKAAVSNWRRLKSESDDLIRVSGLDVAGEGDDETVFSVMEGPCMLSQYPFRKMLTPETIGWAKSLITDDKVESMAIDYGFDPGVTNMLNFERLPIIKVLFGATSPDEKYANFGTYIWALLRDAIMTEKIGILNDPILIYQLSSRRVERLPDGTVKLQSKKHSGQKSPDRGDALALAYYARLMMMTGGTATEIGENEAHKLDTILKRLSPLSSAPSTRMKTTYQRQVEEEEDQDDVKQISSTDAESLRF